MSAAPPSGPGDPVAAFAALPSTLAELAAADDLDTLLARAAELTRSRCGFRRCVVLTLDNRQLVADRTGALQDAASDVLRRRVLVDPHDVTYGSEEDRVLAGQGHDPGGRSALAARLELGEYAFGLIAYGDSPLALLVADRPAPAVTAIERSLLSACGGVIAVALRALVVNVRVKQLSTELRFLAGSAEGFMLDVLDSGMSLPATGRHGPTFSRADLNEPARGHARIDSVLSPREREVAEALVEGRSNRAIAGEMHLSPDTVKGHVAQILRKLNAANRAEAVAHFMRLSP